VSTEAKKVPKTYDDFCKERDAAAKPQPSAVLPPSESGLMLRSVVVVDGEKEKELSAQAQEMVVLKDIARFLYPQVSGLYCGVGSGGNNGTANMNPHLILSAVRCTRTSSTQRSFVRSAC
jgi:hypothetical protein